MAVRPEDLARTLIARGRARLSADATRAADVGARVERAAREMISGGLIRRAWLIGSLAWGGFGERSDVDLVIEGATREETSLLWGRLMDACGEHVDLLRLEELSRSFQARVVNEGLPIHGP